MSNTWIADRTLSFDSSGIRKVFDLAAQLSDPVNLSIGQPDFDVPEPVREACCRAIREGKNGYSVTQGIAPLRDALAAQVASEYHHADRKVFITSGTSGGLVLAMLAVVNPGDEVIVFDPYFVMYEPLIKLVGGSPKLIDTCPTFQIDLDRVAAAITPRTKMLLLNSPANPTGYVASPEEVAGLASLCAEHDVLLLSDEIYRSFCYDAPFVSPAQYNEQTLVIDGFSKSHAMTGWRLGFVHGPARVIDAMLKLQQYTFVCAPQPAQWAGLEALPFDTSAYRDIYRQKRDRIVAGLQDHYALQVPGGAFYVFPEVPQGMTGQAFVERAIQRGLLMIPGNIFSRNDTHFRISYAADDRVIDRGIEILVALADESA